MKNLLVIGGGHPDYRHFTLEEFKLAGHQVTLIDDEKLNSELFDCGFLVDFEKPAEEQAKKFKSSNGFSCDLEQVGFCYIESLIEWASDFFMTLGIDYLDPDVSKHAKSKNLMRKAFSKNNIDSPSFHLYKDESLKSLANTLNYPFIIKSEKGYSSIGVSLINDVQDLNDYLTIENNVITEDYIIEEYIIGQEYSIEGYISKESGINALYKTDKFKTKLPYFEELGQYVNRNVKLNDLDKDLFTSCVNALDIKNSIVHLEVIDNGSGKLFPVELGARLAGDKIPYLHRLIHGESIALKYLSDQIKFDKLTSSGAGIVFFVPKEEGVIDKDFSFKIDDSDVIELRFDIRNTDVKVAPNDYFVRLGFAVLIASSKTEYMIKANKLIEQFETLSGIKLFRIE